MNEKIYNAGFEQAIRKMNEGCFDQAIEKFQEIIKKFPKNAKSYSKLGVCFACQKKFSQARTFLDKAITLDSELAEPYNNLGNICLEEKEYNSAVEYYKKAISLNPDFAAPYSNLGLAYKRLNQYNNAVNSFKRAAEIDRKIPAKKIKEIVNHSKTKINFVNIIFIVIVLLFIWFLLSK